MTILGDKIKKVWKNSGLNTALCRGVALFSAICKSSAIMKLANKVFGKEVTVIRVPLSGSAAGAALSIFGRRLEAYLKTGMVSSIIESARYRSGLSYLNIVSIVVLAATLTNIVLSVFIKRAPGFTGNLFLTYFLIVSLAGISSKAGLKNILDTSVFMGLFRRHGRAA